MVGRDNEGMVSHPGAYKFKSRLKSLLGRVSDSVKEILSPSWLVDLVQSVKKKTPPQTPQEQTYGYSSDNRRHVPNVYPSSSRQPTYSNQENGLSQDPAPYNSTMYSISHGHRDQQQFIQTQQYSVPSGNREPHQFNLSHSGGRDLTHYSNQMANRDMSQFNQQSGNREMPDYNNPTQFSLPGNAQGQQEPVQFTSDSLPFGGLGKLDISSSMLVNGADDQSELNEFASSGCSVDKKDCDKDISRIHQMRQEYGGSVTPSKEIEERGIPATTFHVDNTQSLNERSFLWSGEVKSGSCSSPQPPAKRYKPSFNLSLFGSPVPSTDKDGSSFHDSTYYPGKTTFGGASAHRKNKPKQATPRQMTPNRKQVQAKPLNESTSGVTSSTARKILDSLERMSTPLRDAKKIPSYNSSIADSPLSFTPGVYRRRSFAGRSTYNGPPVQGISSPAAASVTKNLQKAPQANSMASLQRFAMKQAGKTTTEEQSPGIDNNTREATIDIVSLNTESKARSGKMKRERSTFHKSKRTTDEDEEVLEVPDLPTTFTLPVSNLTKIDFGNKTENREVKETTSLTRPPLHSNTKVISNYMETDEMGAQMSTTVTKKQEFSFSSPIAKGLPSDIVSELSPQKFTFSSPISADNETKNSPVFAPVPEMHVKPSEPVLKKKQPVLKLDDSPIGGPLKPATVLKTGSVMDFLKKSSEKLEETVADKNRTGFGSQFQPASGNWSCPTCMVSNKQDLNKCPCCDTTKPGGKTVENNQTNLLSATSSSKVGQDTASVKSANWLSCTKPANQWNCPTCMVNNDESVSKCPCCETAKPSGKETTQSTPDNIGTGVTTDLKFGRGNNNSKIPNTMSSKPPLSAIFKKNMENWDCDTCMVSNKPENIKCIACDMPKPGLKTTTSFKSSGGFQMSETSKTEGSGEVKNAVPAMIFGAFGKDKPGDTGTDVKMGSFTSSGESSQISNFTFGAKDSSESKKDNVVLSGINFGGKIASESPAKPNIKFGNLENINEPSKPDVPSNIKFGNVENINEPSKPVVPSNMKCGDLEKVNQPSKPVVPSGMLFGNDTTKDKTSTGFKFGSSTNVSAIEKKEDSNINEKLSNITPAQVGGFTFGSSQKSSEVKPVSDLFNNVSTSKPSENTDSKVNTGIFDSVFPKPGSKTSTTTSSDSTKTTQSSIFGSAPGGFSFSTPKQSETNPTSVTSSTGGIFGSQPTTEVKKEDIKPSLFTFGQNTTDKTEIKPGSSTENFSFKPSNDSKPASTFSFGTPSTTATSTTSTEAKVTSSLFTFGKTSSNSALISSPGNVGLGVKRERNSNESESAKKEKTDKPDIFGKKSSGFSFGQTSTTAASTGFGGFGSTAPSTTSAFGAGSNTAFGNTASTSISGTPAFGSNLSSGGSSLTFGNASATTSSSTFNSTPSFNFGGATNTTTTNGGSSLFQFGNGSQSQSNNNNPSTFVFGGSQPPADQSAVQPAAGFNFSAQPTMNFGPNQSAFQFSAGNSGSDGSNPFSANPARAGNNIQRRPIKRAIRKIKK